MSAEENKAIVRQLWEAVDRHDVSILDALAAPDVVVHFTGMPEVRGREAWKQLAAAIFSAFPDLQETAEDVIAEGDRVAARVTWRGTHQGELMGIPPSGKQVTVTGMRIFRLAGGQVVEEWAIDDMLGLMQQLGVIPAPGPATQ